MYNFQYNFTKKKIKRCTLLFPDTECNEDPYKTILKNKELFDISNLPVSSEYYCSDNKKYLVK